MLIDSHAHIYPEKIAGKAVSSVGAFYDIGMRRGGTAEDLLKTGQRAGVTHYVVHSVATSAKQVPSINQFISESVRAYPNAFIGLGTMHPDVDSFEAECARIEALGLRGIKLHPDFQKFNIDDSRIMPLYEIAEGRLPILFHTGDYRYDFSHPRRLRNVLRAFPKLRVVGAHFGGWSIFEEGVKYLADTTAMVDSSSASFWLKEPNKMEALIRAYGPDRVMFGSDYPMWDATDELAFLERVNLTAEERERIYWKNAAEFYHITD